MLKGIHDKPGCLDWPIPHSGLKLPPPPPILTCCIQKEILPFRNRMSCLLGGCSAGVFGSP